MNKTCTHCGGKMECYYKDYCPKCDIQDIIKGRRGAIAIVPLINYGEMFLEGFSKRPVWDMICNRTNLSNDTFVELWINCDKEEDKQLIRLLDVLGIPHNEEEESLFLWVSW